MNKLNHNRGAALLLFVLFFTIASSSLILILARGIYSDVLAANILVQSKQSYVLADSFAEDTAYRFIAGMVPDTTENITIFGATATATAVFDSFNNTFEIEAKSDLNDHYRASSLELSIGAGASFNFGVQTGNGGFSMANNSEVIGNVFSNGSIVGAGNAKIIGDAISAGPTGYIFNIHATGSAWAHTIEDSHVGLNLYVASAGDDISNVVDPGGLRFYGQPDQATTTLPIPDSAIASHKASVTDAIAAGDGTLIASTDPECAGGKYYVDFDMTFSGPYKIECDLEIDKNNTDVTLTDTIWVVGNFTVKNADIVAGPATTTDSILVIVDNELNRTTSSRIILDGANFEAPTSPKSYVVLVSMNDDAENGGGVTAIDIGNSTGNNYDDFLAYAGHGEISLVNQIHLKEVTAYQIDMGQNTSIEYESGLLNLNFTSGPGGGFEISGWGETQ